MAFIVTFTYLKLSARGPYLAQWSQVRWDGADSVSKISGSGFKIQMGWGVEGKD